MNTNEFWLLLLVGGIFLLVFLMLPATSIVFGNTPASDTPLFLDVTAPHNNLNHTTQNSEAILKAKTIAINWDVLKHGHAKQIALNLFDDQVVTAVHDRRDQTAGDNYVWVGHIQGQPTSSVSLSVVDSVLVGSIIIDPYEIYEINSSRRITHNLIQLDPQWQHTSFVNDAVYPPETAVYDTPKNLAPTCDDDPSQIDVMVLYTADARIAQGGTAAIEAWINDRISQTNLANANSRLPIQMNLVYMTETDYAPSGIINTDLAFLRRADDIHLAEAHTLRDTYAADLVALVMAEGNNNACGVAYIMNSPASWFADFAFSATGLDYPGPFFCSSTTFTHELGHNQGNQHDHANSFGSGAYPYSHGFQSPQNTFRTLMSYNCVGGCPRINYWSNPDVSVQGEPTGIDYADNPTMAADNARSMEETAQIVANFRRACLQNPPTATSTPPPPSKRYHFFPIIVTN